MVLTVLTVLTVWMVDESPRIAREEDVLGGSYRKMEARNVRVRNAGMLEC